MWGREFFFYPFLYPFTGIFCMSNKQKPSNIVSKEYSWCWLQRWNYSAAVVGLSFLFLFGYLFIVRSGRTVPRQICLYALLMIEVTRQWRRGVLCWEAKVLCALQLMLVGFWWLCWSVLKGWMIGCCCYNLVVLLLLLLLLLMLTGIITLVGYNVCWERTRLSGSLLWLAVLKVQTEKELGLLCFYLYVIRRCLHTRRFLNLSSHKSNFKDFEFR